MKEIAGQQVNAKEVDEGRKARRRNMIISVVFGVAFIALLYWAAKSGLLADETALQQDIAKAGVFAPVLFILISIFASYIPIVPFGSMGSIGIVLFGVWMAFIYNSIVSICNCLIAYALARKFGKRIILLFASEQTVEKYEKKLQGSKHFELVFTLCMFMPICPDLVVCMIAGMQKMKLSHYVPIVFISRPFSSWAYSNGLLLLVKWGASLLHLTA